MDGEEQKKISKTAWIFESETKAMVAMEKKEEEKIENN